MSSRTPHRRHSSIHLLILLFNLKRPVIQSLGIHLFIAWWTTWMAYSWHWPLGMKQMLMFLPHGHKQDVCIGSVRHPGMAHFLPTLLICDGIWKPAPCSCLIQWLKEWKALGWFLRPPEVEWHEFPHRMLKTTLTGENRCMGSFKKHITV